MSASPDIVSNLETRLVALAAELLLAKPDSDGALVSIYSLIAEMEGDVVSAPALRDAVRNVKGELEKLLDQVRPLDRAALSELNRFVSWLRQAVAAQKAGAVTPDFAPMQLGSVPVAAAAAVAPLPPDALLELDLENSRGLLADFHAETCEHLEAIERACLSLEQDGGDRESLDSAFRAFHSIKGNAGFLGLRPLQLIAHEVESILDAVRQGRLTISSSLIDQILRGRDAMVTLTGQVGAALQTGEMPLSIVPIRALLQEMRELPRADAAVNSLSTKAGGVPPVVAAPAVMPAGQTIRVPLERLNRLREVVGELIILRDALQSSRVAPEIEPLAQQLTRVSSEIDRLTQSLRLVPIQPLFQKMERLVRDLAQGFGKQVGLSLTGGEAELDRSMVEGLSDPLMHMVRNALDHGIELPSERRAAGKPEMGSVALRALRTVGEIVVELQDDGRGIDPERVRRVAVQRGIIAPEATLSRDELLALIFAPGFSTAETVTAVSGRGVGMDVLKRNIDRLGGRVEIHSVVGSGTTLRIILPLEAPMISVQVFRSGDKHYAVGAAAVVALTEVGRPTGEGENGLASVSLHGDEVPVYQLDSDGVLRTAAAGAVGGPAVVVESHGRRVALLTSALLGKQDVIFSVHQSQPRRRRFETGIAQLADGAEVTLLNVYSLLLEAPRAAI
jgi:two-component system chemotaxis sensor kinase CheA